MDKNKIKETLEKQLQLLSERSAETIGIIWNLRNYPSLCACWQRLSIGFVRAFRETLLKRFNKIRDLVCAVYVDRVSIAAGIKYMKVYRQMKMYNDPATNPVLYKK